MKSHILRASLMKRDLTLNKWANRRGYRAGTVRQVVSRWIAGDKRRVGDPTGDLTKRIIADLSRDLGVNVMEEIVDGDE